MHFFAFFTLALATVATAGKKSKSSSLQLNDVSMSTALSTITQNKTVTQLNTFTRTIEKDVTSTSIVTATSTKTVNAVSTATVFHTNVHNVTQTITYTSSVTQIRDVISTSTIVVDLTRTSFATTVVPVTSLQTIDETTADIETSTAYTTNVITTLSYTTTPVVLTSTITSISTLTVPYTATSTKLTTLTSYTTTALASTNYRTATVIATSTSTKQVYATVTLQTATISPTCCIPTPSANPSPTNGDTDNCGITGTWDPDYDNLNYYNTTASGAFGCAEICLNDQYCQAFAVSSVSDPNAMCALWSATTAFNGFEETTNMADMRYYDIDCFVNAGCNTTATPLCAGYVEGDVGFAPVQTGYYDDYDYSSNRRRR